jgi:hypothetical protein
MTSSCALVDEVARGQDTKFPDACKQRRETAAPPVYSTLRGRQIFV